MKKNLNVDAMILDLRNVQEDFLDRYEQIKLDCMIALTSPRVQTLLSQHNISLDSMLCKNVPEEVSVGVVNGKVTLSSASQTAAGEAELKNLGIEDYTAVQSQSAALMEVAAGTCDACVIDITMDNAMTGTGTGYPDLTSCLELSTEEYGIAFRKGSDLTAKVNELMATLMTDGTLDALAEKYALTLVK